ncbi:MAG: EamA family transporter [Gaiellaceae bacterium]
MIAIAGGLGAAFMWAGAVLCTSRASRLIGPGSVLGWVAVVGLLLAGPFALVADPESVSADSLAWLGVAGATNSGGLLLVYSALGRGKVGIVAPITSTEGAVAALIAVAAGESISPGAGVVLGVIALGIVLAAASPSPTTVDAHDHARPAVFLALGAALLFGLGLYATGRVSDELPLAWVVLPTRAVGFVAVTLPLLASSRLRLTARAAPLVVAAGIAEVLGFASFVVGARHGIAVSAVLASQFAAVAAVGAFLLFRERLAPIQVTGVAVIAVAVAVLSGLQS